MLNQDMEEFQRRFARGYEVLLAEIMKEDAFKAEEDKPIPPGAIIL